VTAQSEPAARLDQAYDLMSAYAENMDPEVLAEAIPSFRYAAYSDSPDIDKLWVLNDLGAALMQLYQHTGDQDVLRESVEVLREVVAGTPEDDPDLGMCLSNLGNVLGVLFVCTGEVQAIEDAVHCHRAAAATVPPEHELHSSYLVNLAAALFVHFQYSQDQEVLAEAIDLLRAVLAEPDQDVGKSVTNTAAHTMAQGNLGSALMAQFESTGDPVTLRDAIENLKGALAVLPADHPDRVLFLCHLGVALRLSFDAAERDAELVEAVEALRTAAATAPVEHPLYGSAKDGLGSALLRLYERTGELGHLDEGIDALRVALAAFREDHYLRPVCLANLGGALKVKYDRVGDLGLLTESVELLRLGVRLSSAGEPDGPESAADARLLSNLGATLLAWYERTDEYDHLLEAIASFQAALKCSPPGQPERTAMLTNLGGAIGMLGLGTKNADVIAGAVAVLRGVVDSTPADHPDRVAAQNGLGNALRVQFDGTDRAEQLAEVVQLHRAAFDATAPDHPDRAGRALDLADALNKLYTLAKQPELLTEATTLCRQAAEQLSAPAETRLFAYRDLAKLLPSVGFTAQDALAAYEAAVALMPQLTPRRLVRADREHRLGQLAALPGQAAAAAISADRPEYAVELLEQTRGLLLAETLGSRSEVSGLRKSEPELAAAFERLRDRMAALEAGHLAGEPGAAGGLRQAADEWDGLLARIRARPGCSGFLAAPAIRELQQRVGRGPIVIVNPSAARCDALILTTDPERPVLHVPLPGLTHGDVSRQGQKLRAARYAGVRDLDPVEDRPGQDAVNEVLAWLWDTVAEPILTALGYTEAPQGGESDGTWPHVWWCPVGAMTYLPLHAAGHHEEVVAGTPNPRTVPDRVVSSYTSTVRALAYSAGASGTFDEVGNQSALIVAMPTTAGARDLPGVTTECTLLQRFLPGATIMTGEAATYGSVLAALPEHSIAHFACHGLSDRDEPATSRLLLHDHATHPLTVSVVSRLNLSGADLAYLSACSTTDTSPLMTDEALHITSAFQLAGYRHVIGTLWPVDDLAATRIAAEVYDHLTSHGTQPPATANTALALHHAVRRLRSDHPDTPIMWASHIHVGV
jgi:CHAT domain/Tetratricopeptide repeat